MGIGVSLILIAVGAVLAFAVHVATGGGGVGGRRTVVEKRAPARRRTVVEDEVVE